MPEKIERFSKPAQQVMSFASEEAGDNDHGVVAPIHLVLGLVRERQGIGGRVLRRLGMDETKTRQAFQNLVASMEWPQNKYIVLSPEVKKVLELAVTEARRLREDHVGTEHLLLALLQMENDPAMTLLTSLNADILKVKASVLEELEIQEDVDMPNRMQRFSQNARHAITLAEEEARRYEHPYIGAEHILLGIFLENATFGSKILRSFKLSEQELRAQVEAAEPKSTTKPKPPLDLSDSAKNVLEYAVREALRWGSHIIRTEHLLLAIVGDEAGPAIEILKRLKLNPAEIRTATLEAMQPPPRTESTEEKAPVDVAPISPEERSTPEPRKSSSSRMERFTQRARHVMSLAQEHAERLQHSYIGTEHILIGLMREEGGIAGRVLRDLGLDERRVEDLVERMTRAGQQTGNTRLDLSPGTKKVLELAVDEARRLGHHYIGTEHILLGVVRQSEGIAIEVLKRLNVTPEEVRRQVRRVLQESPMQRPTNRPTPDNPPPPTPNSDAASYRQQKADFERLNTAQSAEQSRKRRTNYERLDATSSSEPTPYVWWYFVLRVAEDEAKLRNAHYIGTEHVLVGLLRNPHSGIGDVVRQQIKDVFELIQQYEKLPRPADPAPAKLEFSEHLKTVLWMTIDEAYHSRHFFLHPLHLFLALLRQGDNTALTILKNLGVDLNALEVAIRKEFPGSQYNWGKPDEPPAEK
jgi:ATP-dependent Clp protease ATP-binding subunit ClpA